MQKRLWEPPIRYVCTELTFPNLTLWKTLWKAIPFSGDSSTLACSSECFPAGILLKNLCGTSLCLQRKTRSCWWDRGCWDGVIIMQRRREEVYDMETLLGVHARSFDLQQTDAKIDACRFSRCCVHNPVFPSRVKVSFSFLRIQAILVVCLANRALPKFWTTLLKQWQFLGFLSWKPGALL